MEIALKNCRKHFVINGEAVVLGADGVSDFNGLHSGRYNGEAQLCAFDVLALDGEDLRGLPLKMNLLRGRPDGIFITETGAIGPDLFWAGCLGRAPRVWFQSAPMCHIAAASRKAGLR